MSAKQDPWAPKQDLDSERSFRTRPPTVHATPERSKTAPEEAVLPSKAPSHSRSGSGGWKDRKNKDLPALPQQVDKALPPSPTEQRTIRDFEVLQSRFQNLQLQLNNINAILSDQNDRPPPYSEVDRVQVFNYEIAATSREEREASIELHTPYPMDRPPLDISCGGMPSNHSSPFASANISMTYKVPAKPPEVISAEILRVLDRRGIKDQSSDNRLICLLQLRCNHRVTSIEFQVEILSIPKTHSVVQALMNGVDAKKRTICFAYLSTNTSREASRLFRREVEKIMLGLQNESRVTLGISDGRI